MSAWSGRFAKRVRPGMIGLCLASGLAALGSPGPAAADWVNGDQYQYSRSGVPDLDQRRSALPASAAGDGGDAYCAPTAIMNWLAYMAQHWTSIAPGPGDWAPGAPAASYYYAYMNGALGNLGALMGTDPEVGTTLDGTYVGLGHWLDFYPQGVNFVPLAYHFWGNYMPAFSEIALTAIEHGHGVSPVIGWYSDPLPAGNPEGLPEGTRVRRGGHVVTLVGALKLGGDPLVTFNDPWTTPDSDLGTQSPFQPLTSPTEETTGLFGHLGGNGAPTAASRTFARLVTYSSGSGHIDGFVAIAPKIGLTLQGVKIIKGFKILPPKKGSRAASVEERSYRTIGGRIADVALNPVGTKHPYLVEGLDAVWLLDTVTGESSQLLAVVGPRRLVLDGGRQVFYILLRDELVMADLSGHILARTRLGAPLDAIALDEAHGVLVGVSAAGSALLEFRRDDLGLQRRLALPPFAVDIRQNRLSMSIDPRSGTIWLLRAGSSWLTRLSRDGEGGLSVSQLALAGKPRPTEGLYVDEHGILFVTVNGQIQAFDGTGQRQRGYVFDGRRGETVLHVLRPSTNVEPGALAGPSWHNVPPGSR